MVEVNPITQFSFAMEIRGLERLLSGKYKPLRKGRKEKVLTGCNVSSLVIDSLYDRVRGQNIAVACFYFNFASQKEQSPAGVLGALLKRVVSGMEKIPEDIAQAYED